MSITSHQIKIGLRGALAKGYQVFFEVGNDTGTRVSRHADAVAIGIWPSTGHQLHGYEIKISRGDFLNEMKNPQKAWPVMRFCHRWSLLTPPGLVKVDELPPNWGLQTYDGKTMRTVKQAPMLTPETMSPGFVAALVRRAGDVDAGIIDAAVNKACGELSRRHADEIDRKLRRQSETKLRASEEAVKIVEKLRAELGDRYMSELSVPEIAAAVRMIRKSGVVSVHGGVAKLAATLEREAARIRSAIDDL